MPLARRNKRRVKQRSKSHQEYVSKKKTKKRKARAKVGYGARKRRAKKARGK